MTIKTCPVTNASTCTNNAGCLFIQSPSERVFFLIHTSRPRIITYKLSQECVRDTDSQLDQKVHDTVKHTVLVYLVYPQLLVGQEELRL